MTSTAAGRTAAQTREKTILLVMAGASGEFCYFGFDALSRMTGIEKRVVRLDVRRMARKGLTQYRRGLWTDNGEMAGSGYAITDAGRAAARTGGA